METLKNVEGEMDRFNERRKSERFKCKKYILHNTDPGDFFYRGMVCDYSKKGLYFESNFDLLPEDEITILIKKNSNDLNYILDVKNLKMHFPVLSGVFRRQTGSVFAVDDVSLRI